jgi:chromosome partitioning protein
MAQRARVMLLKRADDQLKRVVGESVRGIGSSPLERDSQGELLAEPKSVVVREGTARSRADSVRQLYGVRATRSGILFVQPLSAGFQVAIAGDFGGWAVTPLKRNEQLGVYELCLPLGPGRKRYRLIVDGRWTTDPYNDLSEPNPFGELNSIIDVAAPAHQTA